MPKIERLMIVGLGLLGGSIALAARAVVTSIAGSDASQEVLTKAMTHGYVDSVSALDGDDARNADLIVVCTPVNSVAPIVKQLLKVAKPDAIVTDVGSTKGNIIRELEGYGNDGPFFVGSHPLAGSEHAGIEYSDRNLFHNRLILTTPTAETPKPVLERLHHFWQSLGANVEAMDAVEHDRILSRTSHLPHAVASALAGITSPSILKYTAGGFRDTTRRASGTPSMWTPILQANRDEILTTLRDFQARLDELKRMLETNNTDEIYHWLEEAKKVRDALGS